MSLNPECVRDTLLTIHREDFGHGWVFYKDSSLLGKYKEKEIVHHVKLFVMADLVVDVRGIFGNYFDIKGGLSEEGKQFADNINDDDVWTRLMEKFAQLPLLKTK